jgi:hypothetical protein
MQGNPVILVNRTSEPLTFVADSRHYILNPGDNYGFFEGHSRFAMAQNPLMGSEDYYTLEFKSRVGVKGETDCSPISDEELLAAMDEVERFDRSTADLAPVRRVKPRHAPPRGRQVAGQANENAFAVGQP